MGLLILIISSIWVYFDAKNIGVRKELGSGFFNADPGGWCAITLLVWMIGFPAYLIKRGSYKAAVAKENNAVDMNSANSSESEIIASLGKIANLRDRGILTEAEFEKQKRKLLLV